MSSSDKVLDIIEAVQDHEEGLSLSELAEITRLTTSTVHRLCSNLVRRGYLYQRKRRSDYQPGPKLLQFRSFSPSSGIREIANPFLNKLCEDSSETVMLAVFFGITIVAVDFVFPKQTVVAIPNPRGQYPLHCTSMGKILLAHMPNKEINNIVNSIGLKSYTKNTITDKTILNEEIEKVINTGVAFDEEEYLYGVVSVAAPVKGEKVQLVAINALVCPSSRVNSIKLKQLAPAVSNCALEISHSLGYRGR